MLDDMLLVDQVNGSSYSVNIWWIGTKLQNKAIYK